MNGKTIFVITITVVVTIILMQNTDEMTFWIFGQAKVPKLAVLGVLFVIGFITGYLAGKPKKREEKYIPINDSDYDNKTITNTGDLSDEDKKYIS